ncbi:hypothetical protein LTR56_024246 [Elasticomyces elasticus]|nr:hypothetical protein LTR56_024246 [Elasticomyces elasticus]KAK3639680.1 hypothetical protein LTR22_017353 [Elasticomyces elasticus]KAK4913458.1 hypothetical protein LTR49_018254 [Elasticomyces elasticus]KAK5760972.1 hypothetical protein LTS12_008820 [Elasticomyces elasticus]
MPLSTAAESYFLALGAAIAALPLYLAVKVVRQISQTLFVGGIPGETNTALLATPLPKEQPKDHRAFAHRSARDLSGVVEYDYIIVGGGTAGCVLGSRLSEEPDVTVLVVEAGHSDLKYLMARIPVGGGQLMLSGAANWDYRTEAEPFMDGQKMWWPRGRLLGGSSSINMLCYNKGSPDDYDEWKSLGNEGWGYDIMKHYLRKAECLTPSDTDPLTEKELEQHGRTGPWQIKYGDTADLTRKIAVGIPKVSDLNSAAGCLGTSIFQRTIDGKGHRSSAATAYITSEVATRTNLRIAVGQTVTQIIFDTSGKEPRAVGVEMAASPSSPVRYLAKAKHEVVLSAGAIATPQLLMLSGVGPADELQKHNIPLVANVPSVGANVSDHLMVAMIFKSKMASLQYLLSPIKSLPALLEWLRFGTGPMTTNVGEGACFFRSADRPDAPTELKKNDETSGKTSPDIEIVFGSAAFMNHGFKTAPVDKDWATVAPVILRPTSRGIITLVDESPFTPPCIKANYLSTKHDRDLMIYAMRVAIDIVRATPLRDVFGGWWASCFDVPESPTDEQLLQHVRKNGQTIYHATGSAKMGPVTDKMSVVDDRLRMHGIKGLRIVDASIFPTPVACHPCAVVVAVAEKAADMIGEDSMSKT